ncbi:MAG: type II toxin-antitoxin system VapC family toxin, partial [Candidatus Latescibacteria bacterium]|nr:type II toxin-antitoxin system VapC family toxin [Candidatus Latescibacterota bacterium]
MPICFFDTSALAKYYHEEIGTQHVISLIDTPDNRIYISRLALTEWHSAFTRKVRIGTLPISNFQIAKQTFYSDLRNRRLIIINLERVHQHHAVRLLKNYGLTQNLRTLDALQLAVALDLN